MINLANKNISGSKFEKVAELCNVSVNKNTISTDKSALNPTGIRLGTPAMTTRGFVEKDFQFVAEILDKICCLTIKIQLKCVSSKLSEFIEHEKIFFEEIDGIKQTVSDYCCSFPLTF
jgi:glycine hydroxymethyltransferase